MLFRRLLLIYCGLEHETVGCV